MLRTTAPDTNNKYYKHTSAGGVNKCIHIANGSCLPNCVGYAWGAWYEMLGTEPKLSRGNAENWYDNNDGYERGQEPRLGAVACWRKGKAFDSSDGCGHVAIVIGIDGENITFAESNYGGTRWQTRTRKNAALSGQTFQGYIYLPGSETAAKTPENAPKCEITTEQALEKMARDVIAGKYGNGEARKNAIFRAVQGKVNELLR